MFPMFRYLPVALLASTWALNPVWAYYGMDCGCWAPEPPCCVSCCSECGVVYVCPSCEPCSSCEAAPVEQPACCGEVIPEKAHAGKMPSQPTPAKPDTSQAPGPAKEPQPKPKEKPPVVTEKPAPQPVAPAPITPAAPAEAKPVVPAETAPAKEMPAPEETPLESKTEEMEDIFGVPATTPAPPPEATPPAEEPKTEEPEKKEEEPQKEEDSFEDFFSAIPRSSTLKVAGGLQSDSHRTWTDNTGKYHCQARLVSVTSHEVVLSKADGKLKTVSLRRLSDEDLQFVHAQVVAKQQMPSRQTADGTLASHWAE